MSLPINSARPSTWQSKLATRCPMNDITNLLYLPMTCKLCAVCVPLKDICWYMEHPTKRQNVIKNKGQSHICRQKPLRASLARHTHLLSHVGVQHPGIKLNFDFTSGPLNGQLRNHPQQVFGVSLVLLSSFALVHEACAFYEFSVWPSEKVIQRTGWSQTWNMSGHL